MKQLLAILAVCALINPANTQPATTTSPEGITAQASIAIASEHAGIKSVPAQTENQELIAAKQQIKLLENQVAMLREFHSSILNTVYWALGGVFVVLGFLVGFSWFANLKVYDRDKQALQADLDARIRAALSDLGADFEKRANQLGSEIDTRLEQLPRTIENLEERITKNMRSSVQANLTYFEDAVARLQRDSLRHAINYAPTPEAAVMKACTLLYLTNQKAPQDIPDVISTIMKILEKGCSLSAQDITNLISTLDLLPPQHAAFIERLREKLVSSSLK